MTQHHNTVDLTGFEKFATRHIGPDEQQLAQMLETIGVESLAELIDQTVPASIRLEGELKLPKAVSEHEFLNNLQKVADKNQVYRSLIGCGYHGTLTPAVILRNIFENPGWYTAYTPYQAEIAQGRLEMLINYQTLVLDLTGLEVTNASLLDEATAAAEAMSMIFASRKGSKKKSTKLFVADSVHPQTLEVLKTRSEPIGIELVVDRFIAFDPTDDQYFGILLQYPDTNGEVIDFTELLQLCQQNNIASILAADPMSLVLLKSPGEMGADIAVGSMQRFGVPMGYGGPHAAYLAARDSYKRLMPGRIIGVSKDTDGNQAYRMALQTREQHIKRERATSNICTAQVLLAVMAAAYAVYHGPKGLRKIAGRIHGLTSRLRYGLEKLEYDIVNLHQFDTLKIRLSEPGLIERVKQLTEEQQINLRYYDSRHVGITLDEVSTLDEVEQLIDIFAKAARWKVVLNTHNNADTHNVSLAQSIQREDKILTHPVFNQHHSEHEMLRYLKHLENKDLSLVHSMIALGSCTMKLNATTEMIPVSWPKFASLHPFAPKEQAKGYAEIFRNLEKYLSVITGFDAVSLQPNSGAQGEYAGLDVHPQLSPRQWRYPPRCCAHSIVSTWYKPGQCRNERNESSYRSVRRGRQYRL